MALFLQSTDGGADLMRIAARCVRVAAASAASGVVAQLAIEKAGSLDPKKVRDALAGLEAETFFGPVKFNQGGQNIGSKIFIFQIQNGTRKTIHPANIADSKIVYPKP